MPNRFTTNRAAGAVIVLAFLLYLDALVQAIRTDMADPAWAIWFGLSLGAFYVALDAIAQNYTRKGDYSAGYRKQSKLKRFLPTLENAKLLTGAIVFASSLCVLLSAVMLLPADLGTEDHTAWVRGVLIFGFIMLPASLIYRFLRDRSKLIQTKARENRREDISQIMTERLRNDGHEI